MKEYKQRTKHLGLPVPGYGDGLWPELELKKWQLVENMLLAATRGIVNCSFSEGDYKLSGNQDGSFTVILRAVDGTCPAAVGVAGGVFFNVTTNVRWDGLEKGYCHYLTLRTTNKTFADTGDVRAVSSRFKSNNRRDLLMAVADLTDVPKLDTAPAGKSFADSLASPSKAATPVEMDFMTEGDNGVVMSVAGRVSFVQVCRCASEAKGKMGEVSIGYFGKDSKLVSDNQFAVYNSGATGLPARALVFFR